MSSFFGLSKENIVAKPGFNRWLVPPASIAIHLCIGSVYAWSMFNLALIKTLGVATENIQTTWPRDQSSAEPAATPSVLINAGLNMLHA